MPSPTNDILNPLSLVVPNVSEAVRDTMLSELGTLIYNTTTLKLDICKVAFTAAAGSWGEVTSS